LILDRDAEPEVGQRPGLRTGRAHCLVNPAG
jgi:hypothetical protein